MLSGAARPAAFAHASSSVQLKAEGVGGPSAQGPVEAGSRRPTEGRLAVPPRPHRRGPIEDPGEGAPEPLPWDTLLPRSMEFSSSTWGVHGRLDLVELTGDEVVAVEAKRGAAPKADRHEWGDHDLPYRAWPPDVAQLGLYMALLRDAGLPCHEGRLFYRKDGTHTVIAWSDALERFLRDVVRQPRDEEPTRVLLKDVAHVAVYGPSQVTEQCLQHLLTSGVAVSHHTSAGRLLGLSAPLITQNIGLRRAQFRSADDPERALAVARAIVTAKIRNQRTVLRRYSRGLDHDLEDPSDDLLDDDLPDPERDVPLALDTVSMTKATPVTGPERDVPLGLDPPTELRLEAPAPASPADPDERDGPSAEAPAELASDPRARCAAALRAMTGALRRADNARDLDTLRGHEGEAAAAYFAALPAILPAPWRSDFCGRSRRPPRDRVNALLSFGYALLTRDATAAAARVGLEPMLGFLHVVHPGRPALALDLIEPFRAAWVDTAVLRLLATRGIRRDDFVFSSAGVALTDAGRRALLGAYERRADELTTHPRFGYRMSYRRLLELEARVLGKWLVGEIDQYTPLWTR